MAYPSNRPDEDVQFLIDELPHAIVDRVVQIKRDGQITVLPWTIETP